MTTATYVQPKPWKVPQEWTPDEVCFVICSGESVGKQAAQIARLKGRFIAVKHGVYLRPDADVLFLSENYTAPLAKQFRGTHIIVRGRYDQGLPETVKRVTRSKNHEDLCELRDHVSGYDTGTSAINLAYHFGARTIVLLGYDMTGGHFCPHPRARITQQVFDQHMVPLKRLNQNAKAKGVRIVNCSPISVVTAFEKQHLEAFL